MDAEGVESPVGYGWSMTDSGLMPKLMTQSAAPKELTILTMCQCQQLNLPLVHANMGKQAYCVRLQVVVRVILLILKIQKVLKIKIRKTTHQTVIMIE